LAPLNVTLKQIRAFVAAADTGSLTTAAVVVNSTQSSLSVLIRELEEAIGLRLFDRTTRKLVLTEAGQEYLVHAQRILIEVEHAHLSTTELVERKRGRVVIAAPPIMAAALLPEIIADYHRSYPNISIVVEDMPPAEIVPAVASGQIDCGIGVFGDTPDGVKAVAVLKERMLIIAKAGNPLLARPTLRWSDLRGQPVVAIKGGAQIRREVDVRLRLARITEEPVIEVRQMLTVLGMVSAGLGVAVWPSWASMFLAPFGVEGRPLADAAPQLDVAVVTPSSRGLSPAATSFHAMLTANIGRVVAEVEPSA
jgi:DNA-binding transcriptional LysR family regulator